MACILGWFAVLSSSESRFIRTLCYDPSVLGGPTWLDSASLIYATSSTWQGSDRWRRCKLEPCVEQLTDWFKTEKGVQQGCLLSPVCLTFTLSTTSGLDELQAGIKLDRRNINNLRYTDDTTLMAESEEELKSRLMKVKEESERASLKLNIKNKTQKSMIMASGPITSWQIEGGKVKVVTDFLFLALKSL